MRSQYALRRAIALVLLLVAICTVVAGIVHVPELVAYHTFQGGLRTLDGDALDSPLDALPDGGDLAFIVVWNSNCGACRKQLEILADVAHEIQLTRKLRGRVFTMTVNMGESESVVRQYLAEKDALIPLALLGLPPAGTIPTVYFVGRVGGEWGIIDKSEGLITDLMRVARDYLEYVDGL